MILDIQGRTMLDEEVIPGKGVVQKTFDVSVLPRGFYFVRIAASDFNKILKLILQ